ncbi:uncharacterized protein DSM5745_00828 [Aspergillus mulundensis]|uniref:Uncharacterized protein n=1 Tax=Aspergillus mulundensis TaxID=1810919 RepID=A0A3D8T4M7_9EURO|nr:hypothetical protein DSM5745_00828 [Aspergillus mulundensis]RDW93506.1 hypothetical protein DSM5745_00828 [Aspergillus mulundensis]
MFKQRKISHDLLSSTGRDELGHREQTPQQGEPVDRYTVGWICALQEEYDSACRMLDEEFDDPVELDASDDNTYTFGRVGFHHVVVGCLPAGRYGTNSAACVARDMMRSFPSLRSALMVGIGGGLPTLSNDIRLGDVVVSMPNGVFGGVVQYDLGKRLPNGDFQRTGHLNAPPNKLLGVIPEIRKRYNDPRKPDAIAEHLRRMDDMPDYRRPAHDHLFQAHYTHQGGDSCLSCDPSQLIQREERKGRVVGVHYGTIASGNSVIKDAAVRSELAKSDMNPLCFEMEGAGLMNNLPCLVVRGICDYSDSHKNDVWHKYAALAAAAYARELLIVLKPTKVASMPSWAVEVKTSIECISGHMQEVQTSFDEDRLHRWLCPPDPSTNFNAAIMSLAPGTGTWLLNSKAYKIWKGNRGLEATPVPPIWLRGIPGSGKTVLSSSIIEDCAGLVSSPTTSLLYFFFDFTDAEKRTHDAMVRSFVWQLAGQGSNEMRILSELFSRCNGGRAQPSRKHLYNTFGDMVKGKKDIYIVIDALDECTDRKNVMWLMQKFTSWWKAELHLCVSSRQEKDINKVLQQIVPENGRIVLDKERVNADIHHYLRRRLQVDEGFDKWRKLPNTAQEIERKIMDKADGMFRWAVCQLNSIRGCLDLPMLRDTLSSLPDTMEETYSRILSTIADSHKNYALRILQWLVYAVRPLMIEEIIDVLAVSFNEEGHAFDPRNRLLDVEDILSICSSLVTIEKSGQGLLVKLSHLSVRDYLVSSHTQAFFRNSMESETANTAISSICLRYILQLDTNCYSDRRIRERFPLTTYAVMHWPIHARAAGEGSASVLRLIEELFLLQDESFCTWVCLYKNSVSSGWKDHVRARKDRLPLFYASLLGLTGAVKLILDKGISPNLYDADVGTPLQIALHQGNIDIVECLLARGADPNLKSGVFESPLVEAMSQDREHIAVRLIEYGANPSQTCVEHGCALNMALAKNLATVARCLLDKGANPNANYKPHGTPLQIVSENGNEQMLQWLLDKGANPNIYRGKADSPLQKALYYSRPQIVDVLLRSGAEAIPSICGPALERAAYDGRLEMVRVLISACSHANSCKGHWGVALWMASSSGHEQIVRLLLQKYAHMPADFVGLALEWATVRNHHGIVKLLRQR